MTETMREVLQYLRRFPGATLDDVYMDVPGAHRRKVRALRDLIARGLVVDQGRTTHHRYYVRTTS